MKIAAAHAIAALAREDVPDEVTAAYRGRRLRYGPEYIIPTPFDPRLITAVPPAVAQAAMEQRRRAPADRRHGALPQTRCARRLDPTASRMQLIIERVQRQPQARRLRRGRGGEDASAPRWPGAISGLGTPVLIGREERVARDRCSGIGLEPPDGARDPQRPPVRAQPPPTPSSSTAACSARGLLLRDCQRMVNQDRNVFGACMVAQGDADAMVTGLTRSFPACCDDVQPGDRPASPASALFGLTVMVARGRTVFIADTTVHELPDPEELADIAIQTARTARRMGFTPRVAFLSFSNFGNPPVEQGDARPRRGRASSTGARSTSSTTARCRPTWRSTPS